MNNIKEFDKKYREVISNLCTPELFEAIMKDIQALTESKEEGYKDMPSNKVIGGVYVGQRDSLDEKIIFERVGAFIKKIRKDKNMTQDELGALMQMNKAYISRIENEEIIQRIDTFIKVLKSLGNNIKIELENENDKYELRF